MKKLFLIGFVAVALGVFAGFVAAGVTNFDRLVLGSANYGEDPNTTADITFQNDEYISNSTDGELNFGALVLNVPATVVGENVFTTTGTVDTVTISGATSSDIYIVSGKYVAGVDQQDVLQWKAETGRLLVYRLASGESAAAYSWLRLK